jgi:hypothetical protein
MAYERRSVSTVQARLCGSSATQVVYSLPRLPRGPLALWQAAAAQEAAPW